MSRKLTADPAYFPLPGLVMMAMSVAFLAGCSPSEQAMAEASSALETVAPLESDAPVGDGEARIYLDELTESDISSAKLEGELSCSFSTQRRPPILFATGIVASQEPAQGIIQISGQVEHVGAPGGFDGLLESPTLTGKGLTIRIAVLGPATEGGESPPRPATLEYRGADGATADFDGSWQCGP